MTYLLDINILVALFITDLYLVGLAHRVGGKLATFDTRIPFDALVGTSADVVELVPTA